MNSTGDLAGTIGFVISRIEEEAARKAEPLSAEERSLLNNLPKTPSVSAGVVSSEVIVPRDTAYERLCDLAKSAHQRDVRADPALAVEWEFAAAVAKLNRHPMSWLLQWAGVKLRKPWWDRWLLIAAALAYLFLGGTLIFLAGNGPWSRGRWVVVCFGFALISILLVGASRLIENWQLKNIVSECRKHLSRDE